MTHRTPAPRYARPIPASRLAPPPRRPVTFWDIIRTLYAVAGDAIEREKADRMMLAGFISGAAFVFLAVLITVARS